MDLELFAKKLQQLQNKAELVATEIEKNTDDGVERLNDILPEIESILPDWFYFIEQTKIGEKSMVLGIIKDIAAAGENKDRVLLVDSLIHGLSKMANDYQYVIREALDGEE